MVIADGRGEMGLMVVGLLEKKGGWIGAASRA